MKAGAIDYIAKPVDADDVESALLAAQSQKPSHQKIQCPLIGKMGAYSQGI